MRSWIKVILSFIILISLGIPLVLKLYFRNDRASDVFLIIGLVCLSVVILLLMYRPDGLKLRGLRIVCWCFLMLFTIGAVTSGVLSFYYYYYYNYRILDVLLFSWFISLTAIVFLCIWCPKNSARNKISFPYGMPSPDPNDYSDIVQLIIHSDNLNWQRFYYFLVFNSILFLAWVGLHSSVFLELHKLLLLVLFPLIGLIVGFIWIPAARRGIAFQNYYMAWARYIERGRRSKGGIFTIQSYLTEGEEIEFEKDIVPKENFRKISIPPTSQIVGARQMVYIIPAVVVGAHFVLLFFSLISLINKL